MGNVRLNPLRPRETSGAEGKESLLTTAVILGSKPYH